MLQLFIVAIFVHFLVSQLWSVCTSKEVAGKEDLCDGAGRREKINEHEFYEWNINEFSHVHVTTTHRHCSSPFPSTLNAACGHRKNQFFHNFKCDYRQNWNKCNEYTHRMSANIHLTLNEFNDCVGTISFRQSKCCAILMEDGTSTSTRTHIHTRNQFRSFVCFSSNKIYRLPSFIADSIHQIHFHELKAFAGDENNRPERQLKSCRSNGSIEYMWRWPFFASIFAVFLRFFFTSSASPLSKSLKLANGQQNG